MLESIDFRANSDNFIFDQEIVAQIVEGGWRIAEIPVPVRYFPEASSASFLASTRYGFSILWLLLRYRLHQSGPAQPAVCVVPRALSAGGLIGWIASFHECHANIYSRRDVWLIFGLALLVRVLAALPQTQPNYMDAAYYLVGGQRLAQGYGFTDPYVWHYLDQPQALPHPSHLYWMPLPSILVAVESIDLRRELSRRADSVCAAVGRAAGAGLSHRFAYFRRKAARVDRGPVDDLQPVLSAVLGRAGEFCAVCRVWRAGAVLGERRNQVEMAGRRGLRRSGASVSRRWRVAVAADVARFRSGLHDPDRAQKNLHPSRAAFILHPYLRRLSRRHAAVVSAQSQRHRHTALHCRLANDLDVQL